MDFISSLHVRFQEVHALSEYKDRSTAWLLPLLIVQRDLNPCFHRHPQGKGADSLSPLIQGISYEKMADIVKAYVEALIIKYPYWNRTLGADHFFLTCHDVGARATAKVAHLVKNSIRVVCSPSYNGTFIPHKDVALPQVLQPFPLPAGTSDISER